MDPHTAKLSTRLKENCFFVLLIPFLEFLVLKRVTMCYCRHWKRWDPKSDICACDTTLYLFKKRVLWWLGERKHNDLCWLRTGRKRFLPGKVSKLQFAAKDRKKGCYRVLIFHFTGVKIIIFGFCKGGLWRTSGVLGWYRKRSGSSLSTTRYHKLGPGLCSTVEARCIH